jgi:hypothetical protein
MKVWKLALSIYIVFGIQEVSAQSNISIGVNYYLVSNNRSISSYNSDLYKDYRENNEKSSLGMELGIDLLYRIEKNWFLKSGLGYVQRGYETNEDIIIDPCYSPITCGFRSEIYRYNYSFIEMPMEIVYQTNKQLNFSFTLGTSLLFPLTNEVDWVLRKEQGKQKEQKIITEQYEDSKNLNATLNLGVGIGYRISDKINLKVTPKFNYNLFSHENRDIRDRLYNIGKFLNEDKSTTEHLISYGIGFIIIYDFGNAATNTP